eukprot:3771817-Amphidinium_carterae.1
MLSRTVCSTCVALCNHPAFRFEDSWKPPGGKAWQLLPWCIPGVPTDLQGEGPVGLTNPIVYTNPGFYSGWFSHYCMVIYCPFPEGKRLQILLIHSRSFLKSAMQAWAVDSAWPNPRQLTTIQINDHGFLQRACKRKHNVLTSESVSSDNSLHVTLISSSRRTQAHLPTLLICHVICVLASVPSGGADSGDGRAGDVGATISVGTGISGGEDGAGPRL